MVNEILDLLKETNNKATFFTVASLVRNSQEILNRIVEEGHELASHSCSHKMVSEQTEEEFGDDLKRSQDLLSSVTGQNVAGFRAPSWSVNRENRTYVIDFLKENGFLYDSSIFPFKTFLYGDNEADLYRNMITSDSGNSIHEIPPSVLEFNKIRIPFSGGFYFRVLPYFFIKKGIKITNKKGHPAVMYLHAYDMDPGQPKIIKGFTNRIIHYTKLKSCKAKFKRLLQDFKFGRMDEYVQGLMKGSG